MKKLKPKPKRYYFSVIEECIMTTRYDGYRAGRIEVYDRQEDSEMGFASYEAHFRLPEAMFKSFVELFDEQESDQLPYIRWTNE